jgi:hypothetical protein
VAQNSTATTTPASVLTATGCVRDAAPKTAIVLLQSVATILCAAVVIVVTPALQAAMQTQTVLRLVVASVQSVCPGVLLEASAVRKSLEEAVLKPARAMQIVRWLVVAIEATATPEPLPAQPRQTSAPQNAPVIWIVEPASVASTPDAHEVNAAPSVLSVAKQTMIAQLLFVV